MLLRESPKRNSNPKLRSVFAGRSDSKALSPWKRVQLKRVDKLFRSQPHGWLLVEALALAIIFGFIDYLTGYEVAFWPFYSAPILLILWYGNRRLAIVISVVSTVAWFWADKASGHV